MYIYIYIVIKNFNIYNFEKKYITYIIQIICKIIIDLQETSSRLVKYRLNEIGNTI